MSEDFIATARARILDAAARGTALRIRGGGTKDFLGGEPAGELLDARPHSGIVDYDPSELVLVARAGTRLAQVEQRLAESGQCLPFEPPHFGAGATIGGCVAAGLSGPRRPYAGSVRDYLLGVSMLDGRGELLRFGGRVMKNVAGFDLFRPQAGALGTLGLLLELSFKVLPKPEVEVTRVFEIDGPAAITQMNRHASAPLPLSGAVWLQGRLHLRLSGNAAAVRAACAKLGGDEDAHGAAWWAALREQQLPFFAGEAPLWRVSLPSTAPLPGVGEELVDWGGAQRWLRGELDLDALRAQVAALGGHVSAFRNGPRAQAFQPPAPSLMRLSRELKARFDPQRVFNRGRLYPDL